jgi:hypothetical protein
MKASLDNSIMSSMMLFLDNTLCDKGQGYTNYTGVFYNTNNLYNNLYSYSLPFKQIIADNSVSGANILSGVYINNTFSSIGQNGLSGINHQNGQIFMTSDVLGSTLSGSYAIKDFNIYLSSEPEERILFENQYQVRPKTSQTITGLSPGNITYPALFIKNINTKNESLGFGRFVDSKIEIRVIVMANSLFSLDAVCSYLRDTAYTHIPIIDNTDLKFDYLGSVSNGSYNYNNIKNNKLNTINTAYIEEVSVSKIYNYIDKINASVFPAFVDFTLSKVKKY